MKVLAAREGVYLTLARMTGVLLVFVCVLFQRRGLMDWSELLFLGLCLGLQETFLRLHFLRRWRSAMLFVYSMLPMALVLHHVRTISEHDGRFVEMVLFTPLPMVLVSVQLMVLYVRESARLVSVVLVLSLFSTVIGVRRPVDDPVWAWLAVIGAATTLYLLMQYPGMLFQGAFVSRRRRAMPPSGRPGGVIRAAFLSVMPFFVCAVLLTAGVLYFTLPRIDFAAETRPTEVAMNPADDDGPVAPDAPPPEMPRNPNLPERQGPATVSGLADGIDLGDFGEIKLGDGEAMVVQVIDPTDPPVNEIYLRAFTFGEFDGYGWKPIQPMPETSAEVPTGRRRNLPGAPDTRGRAWRDQRYRIEIRESGLGGSGQLSCPPEPVAIQNYNDPLFYDAKSNTLRGPLAEPGDVYEVASRELSLNPQQLGRELADRASATTPSAEYFQIPQGLQEQIRQRFQFYERYEAMVAGSERGVPGTERGAYAAARNLVTMFREATAGDERAWAYSLDFRPGPGRDAIARFLDTETGQAERYGHCEYFASAMCILLRCYGVPSRVAAGFYASEPNGDGVFEVSARSAHAWVEVYFDGYGWLTFDPTPPEETADEAAPYESAEPAPEEPDTDEPDEVVQDKNEPRGFFDGFDRDDQQRMFSRAAGYVTDALDEADKGLAKLTAWMPGLIPNSGVLRALLLASPLTVAALVFLWRGRRKRKIEARVLEQMGEGGKKRERGLYLQLLLLLARYGYQKRPSETPREFAMRVLRKGGDQHEPIVRLTDIYYALRFGLNREVEGDFKTALAKYAAALKQHAMLTPPKS